MSDVDWQALVAQLAAQDDSTAAWVAEAKKQALHLKGQRHYEAVYTLVKQRQQMDGAR